MNRYMTFWPRFWAGCIDGFALGVISMGVYFPLSLLLGWPLPCPGTPTPSARRTPAPTPNSSGAVPRYRNTTSRQDAQPGRFLEDRLRRRTPAPRPPGCGRCLRMSARHGGGQPAIPGA